MTVDREQTRRDAELTIRAVRINPEWEQLAIKTAERCLALLAELEQAERRAQEFSTWANETLAEHIERAEQAEARLAKVPALVERGKQLADALPLTVPKSAQAWIRNLVPLKRFRDALSAFRG